jgi:hypothetical protein
MKMMLVNKYISNTRDEYRNFIEYLIFSQPNRANAVEAAQNRQVNRENPSFGTVNSWKYSSLID